jgi:hypothetical protein
MVKIRELAVAARAGPCADTAKWPLPTEAGAAAREPGAGQARLQAGPPAQKFPLPASRRCVI